MLDDQDYIFFIANKDNGHLRSLTVGAKLKMYFVPSHILCQSWQMTFWEGSISAAHLQLLLLGRGDKRQILV